MSDEKKTLGQVYSDGMRSVKPGCGLKEVSAAGIAAVCRAVLAERDKSTEFALRAMQIPRVIAAARQAMKLEAAKPEAASEAGDWAYDTISDWHILRDDVPTIPENELKALAEDIRVASERHYSRLGSVEHAKRQADRLDAAQAANKSIQAHNAELVAECERLRAAALDRTAVENADKKPDANLANFDAVRAERDEAIKAVECHKSYHDTEQAIKRAEAAEADLDKIAAELAELKAACNWANETWVTKVSNSVADDIIAAYRSTKGKEPTA